MKKYLFHILCLISFICSSEMLINDQALLFCIDKNESTLDLSEDQTNHSNIQIELDKLFQSISGYNIEPYRCFRIVDKSISSYISKSLIKC